MLIKNNLSDDETEIKQIKYKLSDEGTWNKCSLFSRNNFDEFRKYVIVSYC